MQISDATLRELAEPLTGPEAFLTAKLLSDRSEWLEVIERDFPAVVVRRIRRMIEFSELAQAEIFRRLREAAL